jgi:hypothetical protein
MATLGKKVYPHVYTAKPKPKYEYRFTKSTYKYSTINKYTNNSSDDINIKKPTKTRF